MNEEKRNEKYLPKVDGKSYKFLSRYAEALWNALYWFGCLKAKDPELAKGLSGSEFLDSGWNEWHALSEKLGEREKWMKSPDVSAVKPGTCWVKTSPNRFLSWEPPQRELFRVESVDENGEISDRRVRYYRTVVDVDGTRCGTKRMQGDAEPHCDPLTSFAADVLDGTLRPVPEEIWSRAERLLKLSAELYEDVGKEMEECSEKNQKGGDCDESD